MLMRDQDKIFLSALGAQPQGVGTAHGRVNLIGEHIDYQGGTVLPTAIPNRADVAVILDTDNGHDEIHAMGFGDHVVRTITDPAASHWSDYVAGALQQARAHGLLKGGARVSTHSNVPHGAGLSSSAAIIVATLKAIHTAQNLPIDNLKISRWAQAVEHDFIGMPCGIMDQMAVAIATDGQALCLDTDSLDYSLVTLPKTHHFAVVHSGVTRRLEDGRYRARRRESEAAKAALGVELLCKMTEREARGIDALEPMLRRRARHTYSEHHRVLAAVAALNAGDLSAMGAIMIDSHRSMRDDFEMTTPEIDILVEAAVQRGALGARLTGGGFGGCIVACVPRDGLGDWYKALSADFPAIRLVA